MTDTSNEGRPDFELGPALALLAAPDSPAAGGAAAALAAAAAAAVVGKAASASGRRGEAAQAAALRERLAKLAVSDAAAFGAARAALAAAAEGAQNEQRDFALGRLLRQASVLPREIAEACADLAVLASREAYEVDPNLRADAEAAALLAAGAAAAAAHLVGVNLAVGEHDEDLRRARAAAESARALVSALGDH